MSETLCEVCYGDGTRADSVRTPATRGYFDDRDIRHPVCDVHFFADLLGRLKNSDYRDYVYAVAHGQRGPHGEPPAELAQRIRDFQAEGKVRGVDPDALVLDLHHHTGPGLFLPPEDGETPAPAPEPEPQPSAPPLPAALVKAERKAPPPKNKTAGGSHG